ncbi:MAG: transcriptional repressor [Prevotella sp.]|nr:transcriptional repressor [Prevotella sp.]
MDESLCCELLSEHDIRPTANRILIVKALAAEANPMSMGDLVHATYPIDKSNISRTLALFRARHLVHVIEDGEGDTRYELCRSHDTHGEDDDLHVHFYCESCRRTFCLYDTPVPEVRLPHGFLRESVNYMVKGICATCARKVSLKRFG